MKDSEIRQIKLLAKGMGVSEKDIDEIMGQHGEKPLTPTLLIAIGAQFEPKRVKKVKTDK